MNLAYEAARAGARLLVWDLDPQGAASFYFRIKPRVKGGTERLVGGKAIEMGLPDVAGALRAVLQQTQDHVRDL